MVLVAAAFPKRFDERNGKHGTERSVTVRSSVGVQSTVAEGENRVCGVPHHAGPPSKAPQEVDGIVEGGFPCGYGCCFLCPAISPNATVGSNARR
jgi:hypothetical protein